MMKTIIAAALLLGTIGAGAYLLVPDAGGTDRKQGPGDRDPASTDLAAVQLPDSLTEAAQMGKRAFDAKCAACHGANGAGQQGVAPPLVHQIYEPSHHGDMAFVLAAQNGVRAHHWPFGDMPPVEGITRAEIKLIIRYIRDLQQANGIH